MTIWRLRIACWIPKATNTHSEYVILTALPLKQWLHERASMLRYTYIAWLVTNSPIVDTHGAPRARRSGRKGMLGSRVD
jgi:hypothetical protein